LVVITIVEPEPEAEAEAEADVPACAPVPLLLALLPHAAAVNATAISAPNRTGTGMRVNNELLIIIVSRLARLWLVASAAPCICFLGY
jgi:hypothetical protein